MLEVQVGSPVVRKVIGHLAGCAGGPGTDVTFHGGVEGIATDDVVDVGGREGARLDDGVETLDSQGRTGEAETGLNRRDQREGCRECLHVDEVSLYLGLANLIRGWFWREETKKGILFVWFYSSLNTWYIPRF